MNRQEQDILNILAGGTFSGQRELAEESGYSLGVVNRCLRSLTETGYVRADGTLTQNGQALLAENRPRRAVILAAGFGMRMVPINTETPKGLLQVHGERLIDRLIRQLHQALRAREEVGQKVRAKAKTEDRDVCLIHNFPQLVNLLWG